MLFPLFRFDLAGGGLAALEADVNVFLAFELLGADSSASVNAIGKFFWH
jgi:hypothetical protein